MRSRPLLPRAFRLLRILASLWLALIRLFFHTQCLLVFINTSLLLRGRSVTFLASSKYFRLNEGDHDDRDGSSITAEEDMDGRESTNHVTATEQILDRTLSFPSQISSSSPDIYKP